jgi:hypothetical protein
MEDNKVRNTGSDEIDLSQLFRWIGKGFSNFGQGILNGLASLRALFFKNKVFFGIVIVSGLGLGVLFSEFLQKKHYASSMIISCDYLNSRILTNSMDKLNLLCHEKEKEGLANELKVDINTAKNILSFQSKAFVSEKDLVEIEVLKEQLNNVALDKKDLVSKVIAKIEIENKNAFLIEVKVLDPGIIKNLEQALVNYIKDNSFIQNRIAANERALLERRSKLQRESRKLDSLKSVLFENFSSMAKENNRPGSNNVILSDKYLTNPLDVFKQDLEVHAQIQEIDYKLSVKPDFEVVDGLTSFKEPDNASLPKILAISFLVSWILGYLILGMFKFDRYLSALSKKAEVQS